ncbi:MAG: triphosphoribosyl-dephospho-CoA synthase, partial [Clostridiales bacterium]
AVIGEPLSHIADYGVGKTIEKAIQATWNVVSSNTNLGIVLLFAPLALAFHHIMEKTHTYGDKKGEFLINLRGELEAVLNNLTVDDTVYVYKAIRYVSPGGLGNADDYDVTADTVPDISLKGVMALSAERDLIARQYVNNYSQIFDDGIKYFNDALTSKLSFFDSVAQTHLMLLASTEDTLICRKLGKCISVEAKRLAQEAVVRGGFYTQEGIQYVKRYDQWLREDGHKRNPGSSADIIAAVIFVYFLEKIYTGEIILSNFR